MPGTVDAADLPFLRGWARHPSLPDYPVVVHAISGGQVIASGLAEIMREDGMPGFALRLPPRAARDADVANMRVLIGETDEWLALPRAFAPAPGPRTVEALASTLAPRPWIKGATFHDGAKAGLHAATLIDLLCRDFLGRGAGPGLVAATLARGDSFGLNGLRRAMLASAEYLYRRIDAARAPGAVFSQRTVQAAAAHDFVDAPMARAKAQIVSLHSLTGHDGADFVTTCYRRLLRKEPDAAGLAHYVNELARLTPKAQIVQHLANEFECLDAGIAVGGL